MLLCMREEPFSTKRALESSNENVGELVDQSLESANIALCGCSNMDLDNKKYSRVEPRSVYYISTLCIYIRYKTVPGH